MCMRLLRKTRMRLMACVIACAMVLSLPVMPGVKADGEEVVLWVSGGEPVEPDEEVYFSAMLDWPEAYYDSFGEDEMPDPPDEDEIVFIPGEDVESYERLGIYVDHPSVTDESAGPGQAAYIAKNAVPGEYPIGVYRYVGEVYKCTVKEVPAVICVQDTSESGGDMIKPWEDKAKKLKMQFVLFADGLTPDVALFAGTDELVGSTGSTIKSRLSGKGEIIGAYEFTIKGEGNEEDENDFDKDIYAVSLELEGDYTGITWFKLDPDEGYAVEGEFPMSKKDGKWEGSLDGFGTYAIAGTKEEKPVVPEFETSTLTISVEGEGEVTVTDKKTGKEVADLTKLDPKGTYVINAFPYEDYEFAKWTGVRGTSIGYDFNKDEVEITDLAENVTLTASFRAKEEEDPGSGDDDDEPELSELAAIAGEGGRVSIMDDEGNTLQGDDRKSLDPEGIYYLTAIPDEEAGYEFVGWTLVDGECIIDSDLKEDEIQIHSLSETVVFKATFALKDKEYAALKVETNEGGSYVLKDSKGNEYVGEDLNTLEPEEEYTITAVAKEGYSFVSWFTDDNIETTDDPTKETITFKLAMEKATLRLEFQEDEIPLSALTIKADPTAGGTVEVYDSEGDPVSKENYSFLNSSEQYKLVAAAKDGYKFMVWAVDGAILKDCSAGDNEIIIGDLQQTVSAKAVFLKDLIDISGATVKVNKTYAYTGSEITPAVTVTLDGKTLKKDTDYEVKFSDNKKVGTATVTVIGKGEYQGSTEATFAIKKAVLKYRAYVQKKNWMPFQIAAISSTPVKGSEKIAGTTDNLRMETIQMQLGGVGGEVRYRAYCQKKGWVGVGTAAGGWATTSNKSTNAGTKGESRRVEMIQLQAKGEVATLYDIYYQAYSEKFGWLAWAGNNQKAGSAGYALKLEAFRVQLVPKGASFDTTSGSSKKKSFYDKTKDGANPK